MTDATAGRGGVGIRLFVQGDEVVRRTFDQVGDSGKKMWAEIALGERSANPAIRALSVGAGEVRGAFDGLVGRAGSAGAALAAFGALGLTAAAALGALAIATQGAFQAMESAADLTDTADRIGIGVEALQQLRYVADEAGVDVGTFEGVLEKLNGTLGRFKLGVGDGKLKPVFEELGITKAQLDDVQTADQMLLLLADRLGQIEDRSQQVALARALGIEEALPILRMGSEEIERLTGAASDLGLVLDAETNRRLDEADRKLELAGQQMRVVRDTAVAPLADVFADAAAELSGMAVEFSKIEARAPGWIQTFLAIGRAIPGSGALQRAGEFAYGRAFGHLIPNQNPDQVVDEDDPALLRQRMAESGRGGSGGFEPLGHTSRGGGGGASAAQAEARRREREAEQRRQREERAAQQLERVQQEIDGSYDRGFLSIDAKAAYAVSDLERERASRLREIARAEEEYIRSKGLKGLTEAEAEQLRAKQDELAEQKKAVVEWERRRAIAARRLEDEEASAEAAIELLDIDAQMARTGRERARIERDILLATIEIARKRRSAELANDPEYNDGDRRQLLDQFDRNSNRQVELFDYRESERLREQFKGYGREVVDAIRAGRIGEYIGDKLKERLTDGLLDQLFNLLGGAGGKGGGGAGWLGSAFNVATSFFGGGRAAGGGTEKGRFYATVEHGRPELFMLGGNGQVTSAAETVRMLEESLGGSSPLSTAPVVQQTVHNDFRGAVVTEALIRQMDERAERAKREAVQQSAALARRGAPGVQRDLHRLGTSK